jgi:hypothetical protein
MKLSQKLAVFRHRREALSLYAVAGRLTRAAVTKSAAAQFGGKTAVRMKNLRHQNDL